MTELFAKGGKNINPRLWFENFELLRDLPMISKRIVIQGDIRLVRPTPIKTDEKVVNLSKEGPMNLGTTTAEFCKTS